MDEEKTGNPAADALVAAYLLALQAVVVRAIQEEITRRELERTLFQLAMRYLPPLYVLGGGDLQSAEGQRWLAEQERVHRVSARRFAADVMAGKYTPDEATLADEAQRDRLATVGGIVVFAALLSRLTLWQNTSVGAYTTGQVEATPLAGEEEPRYTWRLGRTERHCSDCLRLDGVTLTASEWARAGIKPQSPQLECGGWHCDCRLELTDAPSIGFENVRT